MSIEFLKYQKNDFLDFATISDDEWKGSHLRVAFSLGTRDGEIVHCYVALDENHIIGYIYGFALPNKILIPEFMYVKPDYRRNGVGAELLNMLEKKSGCEASMIFYHKSLHNHYYKLGYSTGENLETAMKTLGCEED